MQFIENQIFSKKDYILNPLPAAEYDNCTFNGCNFNSADIGGITFADCRFEDCNLTMAGVRHTALKNVIFINCKMVGFNFNFCDSFLLEVAFKDCILHLSSFFGLKLKNTKFAGCDLREADFAQADLTGASFDGCDLSRAIFQDTILEKTDFRTARNYSIDPERNRIKKGKFSKEGIAGLLDRYQIVIE